MSYLYCISYFRTCLLSSVVPLCDVGRAGHTSTPLSILLITRDGSATYASESMNVCLNSSLCISILEQSLMIKLRDCQVNSYVIHILVYCYANFKKRLS
jgi:hypothetical protein